MIDELLRLCDRYNIELSDTFFESSVEFCKILLDWNKTHSLTTFKTNSELVQNVFNSIYPITFLSPFESCLDVGSGAGFPGIPLALTKSESRFVLCESKGKKYAFLEYIKISLGLKNVTVVKDRVENITEKFDLITSRAVGSRELLEDLTRNAVTNNTKMLLYIGEKIKEKEENRDNGTKLFQMPFGNYILIGE